MKITINEALVWQKTLKDRHAELKALRDENAYRERRYIGADAAKEVVKEPLYDVRHLDSLVANLAKEMRRLETAIKMTNATVQVNDYDQDESVLGVLEPAKTIAAAPARRKRS